ncbi:MAG: tRNA (adenosine(37)-N6)-threonylcarbamoyltransferase complex dimerization subunit type 1 TsaB [Dysgonamonadaceae bacterium]|nr:tRNA (adenosine(37)-N6)-threonylcarbamoyltransferase complex dimerization subunit type 1 TsaB [Dysgonamonadaceae bacterium]
MICLLLIETSTKFCSLTLAVDGKSVFDRISLEGASHASLLGVFALEAVKYARANHLKINAIAVSSGPGSYTGLRIGASEAKGLCYGFEIPLIAIPTLKILVSACFTFAPSFAKKSAERLYCPMIDARRMEVYTALYDSSFNEIHPVRAEIIVENSYKEYLDKYSILFFGDGSDKCRPIIQSPNALFVENIYPNAEAMIPLAEKAFKNGEFVDVAYFEPFYLKEFQATIAKNKVFTSTQNSRST